MIKIFNKMVGTKGICTFTAFASVLQTGELTRAQDTHITWSGSRDLNPKSGGYQPPVLPIKLHPVVGRVRFELTSPCFQGTSLTKLDDLPIFIKFNKFLVR